MTLKENYSFLILLLCTISGLNASNILCIFPTSSPSHLITAQSLMSGLAERGHNVTVVSSYPIKKVIKNYREVYVPYSDLHRGKKMRFVLNIYLYYLFDFRINLLSLSLSRTLTRTLTPHSHFLTLFSFFFFRNCRPNCRHQG